MVLVMDAQSSMQLGFDPHAGLYSPSQHWPGGTAVAQAPQHEEELSLEHHNGSFLVPEDDDEAGTRVPVAPSYARDIAYACYKPHRPLIFLF